MILLEIESAIIRNLLESSLDESKVLSESYNCCEFDGVRFMFKILRSKKGKKKGGDEDEEEGGKDPVRIEMCLPCWEDIKDYGAEDFYQKNYGSWIVEPSAGFTHAIVFNLHEMNEAERKNAITLAARLKANMIGAPFLWVAEHIEKKENFSAFEIPYRKATGESIYICPTDKGAVAIFSIRFSDPGDHIIGNVFFGELQAARTRVSSAPTVSFSDDAPADLEAFDLPEAVRNGEMYSFVSINILAPQLSERKRQDIAYYVPMFRDYLHYHIKCTKAFLHQKMRNRATHLLKVLDEAKPEPKVKVYRTVTGKVVNH